MSQQSNQEIYCFSYFKAKANYKDDLIKALLELIAPTREEPGCLQYELLIDNEDSHFIIMLEKFIDQTALDLHENQNYIKNFVENQMTKYCEKVTWNVARKVKE